MATILGVNLHTVGHAYKNLKKEGILEIIQGKGTFIVKKVVRDVALLCQDWITQHVRKKEKEARNEGMTTADILKMAKKMGIHFNYKPKAKKK